MYISGFYFFLRLYQNAEWLCESVYVFTSPRLSFYLSTYRSAHLFPNLFMFSWLSVCICWLSFCWLSGFPTYLLSVVCCLSFFYLNIFWSFCLSVISSSACCLSVCLSTQLISVFLPSCLSVRLSVCVCWLSAVCLSIFLFFFLSVYQCVHVCLWAAHKFFSMVESLGNKVDTSTIRRKAD